MLCAVNIAVNCVVVKLTGTCAGSDITTRSLLRTFETWCLADILNCIYLNTI
jgi:Fe-S cluster biogenesis protein NfuA